MNKIDKIEKEKVFKTGSGRPVKAVYGPEDLKDWDFNEKVGVPGEYPFTRGVHPEMYRTRTWTRRQVVGFGTALESNERNRYVIANGPTGISNDYDVPTLIGLDSDDPLAKGEVGRMGVAIDTLQDMRDLLDGIDLNKISVSQTINPPAPILLGMFVATAQERGYKLENMAGTSQNDALKEFYAQKTFVFPPKPQVRFTCDVVEYCSKNMPRWNGININGYNIRETGATAPQEMAYAFAQAVTYFEDLLARGLSIDDVAPRFSFIFQINNDFFEEIAKFRAGRRYWARMLKERFGAKDPKSWRMRMHVQTAGSTMTYQQPEVNIVRGTIQALAGACGGVQSMAVAGFDEALSIPSEKAHRLSLRTQQVIIHESGVCNTVDPLAGSYYVETLTNQIEEEIDDWMRQIDGRGGALACVESGWLEQNVSDYAHQYQMEIASKERIVVGVNEYQMENEDYDVQTFRVGEDSEREQLRRLAKVKESRDRALVEERLDGLRRTAASGANILEDVISAVKVMATEGEIINALADVVGRHKASAIV
ncbi:methylmalonyl-CoA mutase family protein [Hyphomicrobium sp.]|uniref:acyl-CoA mutase large subunit family protein n=1 Tax=Hyphomicrobium sp. TaxID=82 RepID=UPI0025BF8012|nr:methylmalonyl-CoA mutase family protein [Hyphomicrobium sp.]MCC7250500.1 methylmalonyl-CoA mutase [Hyphomicrobium sp.]